MDDDNNNKLRKNGPYMANQVLAALLPEGIRRWVSLGLLEALDLPLLRGFCVSSSEASRM
jgi:hypothetical protein